MSVFVHAQGIKPVKGGVKKWQNSVHVIVECPYLISCFTRIFVPRKNRITQILKSQLIKKIPHSDTYLCGLKIA